MRVQIILGAAILLAIEASCTSSAAHTGVVTGGIVACEGVPAPNARHYAAGIVTVLGGQVRQTSEGLGLPPNVIATEAVAVNSTYRFTLQSGRYALQAQVPPYHPNVVASEWPVDVRAGETVKVDISYACR
ncbi:MAG: hypothetical protein ACREOY_10905 [Candidatus Dormibacteraceae bacterium]